jgi:hypothetical protein
MINLQFVRGKGFSSKLIAWWGNGYDGLSHVDAILSTGECLGARSDIIKPIGGGPEIPAGVQIRPPFYEKWDKRVVVSIPSTPAQANAWDWYLRKQINDGYDTSDIIGLIIGKPIMQSGHWICSALQTDALQYEPVGLLGKLGQPPQQITPNTLFEVSLAIGGKVAA